MGAYAEMNSEERLEKVFHRGKVIARSAYVFLALGFGLSYVLQQDVVVGGRTVLERLPVPFWVYGIFFLILGATKAFAMVTDNSTVFSRCLQTSIFFWSSLAVGFGLSALEDPVHVPFTGFVAFLFIALMHIVGSGIEGIRGVYDD